jgi:hypothetical protein
MLNKDFLIDHALTVRRAGLVTLLVGNFASAEAPSAICVDLNGGVYASVLLEWNIKF